MTTFLALVRRIADGDRDALMTLCTRLGPAVCARAGDDPAVVLSTFVEVWWLAGHHCAPGTDVPQWILGIAGRRAFDSRPGTADGPPISPYDAALVALAELLGDSRSAVRARSIVAA